jgi:peptidoglycan/xylan/chitin deacetylase (PgdA/CDA1 family)
MILMYHDISPEIVNDYCVSLDVFADQMNYLRKYEVVNLADYDLGNPRHVVITFDDGCSNVIQHALPIMEKHSYPFEIFVVGDFIHGNVSGESGFDQANGYAHLDKLKQAADSLGRIQWHSRSHPNLSRLSIDIIQQELDVPAHFRDLFPPPHFRWFAYPYGEHDGRVVDEARQRFDGAVSVYLGNNVDRFQLNRIMVTDTSKFFLDSYEKDVVMARMENEIRVKDTRLVMMETILTSRSWRYTAPLRKLGQLASKIRNSFVK